MERPLLFIHSVDNIKENRSQAHFDSRVKTVAETRSKLEKIIKLHKNGTPVLCVINNDTGYPIELESNRLTYLSNDIKRNVNIHNIKYFEIKKIVSNKH